MEDQPEQPLWATQRKEFILSLDLTEATYTMSHDIMDINYEFMDTMMAKFLPWKVFHRLFKINQRLVDFRNLKSDGYYPEEYPDFQTTVHGCFMGDATSFIHLTMVLSSLVDQAAFHDSGRRNSRHVFQQVYIARPLGQSVGDDLILLSIDKKFGEIFLAKVAEMGLKVSKINALSNDTGTFCESYVVRLSDLYELKTAPKESIFGDLLFLDVLKGNLMTGKSKVSMSNADPFLGHAKMLNKQIAYLPREFQWKSRRAKVVLWCRNYKKAVKLGRSKPHLPEILGGLDIAVGACDSFESQLMQDKYVPYLCAMLSMERNDFLRYWILLSGIYRANPKGFPWSNDEEIIAKVISKCEVTIDEQDIFPKLPSWIADKPIGSKLRYINQQLGYMPVRQIVDELSRREAFLNFWKGKTPDKFMTMNLKDARSRHDEVWKIIRTEVKKVPIPYHITSFNKLKTEFELRTWGLYVNREDPAIAEAFKGTPSMYIWLKKST
jgi:hypothetical protein